MSAVNREQEVSLSDNYVLLLQDTIKESRVLRPGCLAEKEDQVESRLEQLFTKVEELCDKVTNADSCRKRKRTNSSSVKVPRQCRVRSVCFISFNLVIEETFFPDVFYGKNVLTLFKLKFKLSFVLYCDGFHFALF